MTTACSVEWCERPKGRARGLCSLHYDRQRKGVPMTGRVRNPPTKGTPCSVEGCGKPSIAARLCRGHYKRKLRGAEVHSPLNPKAPNGQGTKVSGYIRIRVDGEFITQHRHVMEQHLGRKLATHENVHHVNGDRADNRIENLELWSTHQPPGQRVTDKINWAIELLAEYGYTVTAPRESHVPHSDSSVDTHAATG